MEHKSLDKQRAGLEAEYFAREDARKLAALRDRRTPPARPRESHDEGADQQARRRPPTDLAASRARRANRRRR